MDFSATKTTNALMDKLGFDDETLAANRDGYMTKAQRERLREDLNVPHPLAVGMGLLGILIGTHFLIQWLLSLQDVDDRGTFLIILVVTGAIFIPLLMYTIHTQRQQTRSDLEKGTVLAACGPAQLELGWKVRSVRTITPDTHQLTIDGVRFAVSEAVLLTFHNGSPYCVYYLPHRKMILSAEPLT